MKSILALLLMCRVAAADPLDEFAMGSRLGGMAGAGTAAGVGAEAVHLNPAGVAYATHPEVMLGYGYGMMRLALDGRDDQEPRGHPHTRCRGAAHGANHVARRDRHEVEHGFVLQPERVR
ncbi:MAG TPA: hypothetical protein VL172_10415, partial [Kofleriaceae bacterium]|nr:hypothetical protein [Kofleriaceae bacterium]